MSLADTDGEEMHMRTDYPGVVMRRMLAKLLADHGETEQRRRLRRRQGSIGSLPHTRSKT